MRRVSVNAAELSKFQAILAEHEMKFQVTETRNDFRQVTRAAFDVEVKFICSFTLRADYAAQTAELTCRNIGPLGRRRYQIPGAMLGNQLFEELSKVILGYPSEMLERFALAA